MVSFMVLTVGSRHRGEVAKKQTPSGRFIITMYEPVVRYIGPLFMKGDYSTEDLVSCPMRLIAAAFRRVYEVCFPLLCSNQAALLRNNIKSTGLIQIYFYSDTPQ